MKNVLVLVNYNDYNTTLKFLKNICNYKAIDYIIVVDNHSTDISYEILKKLENKKIKVLLSDKNGGYGYGNNIGIKYAIKKYKQCNLIITNPDIIVSEEVIIKLISSLNNNSKYALVAPLINTANKISRGWKLTTPFMEMLLSIPILATKYRNEIIGYKKTHYKNILSDVDVVSGCFFVARSNAFENIGYYDENLFLFYEENVIAKKLKNIGYKSAINIECEVIHEHSVSINKNKSNKQKFVILKQSQIYYLKNYCNCNVFILNIIKLLNKISLMIKK